LGEEKLEIDCIKTLHPWSNFKQRIRSNEMVFFRKEDEPFLKRRRRDRV